MTSFDKLRRFSGKQRANKSRLITIVNWDIYQGGTDRDDKASDKQMTSNRQADDKQMTSNRQADDKQKMRSGITTSEDRVITNEVRSLVFKHFVINFLPELE